MHNAQLAGVVATGVGCLGYATGVFVAYPGRALSLTLLMGGIALIAVGRTEASQEV